MQQASRPQHEPLPWLTWRHHSPRGTSPQVLRAFDVEPNDETVEGVLLGTGMQAKFPLEGTSHSIENADEVAAAPLLSQTPPLAPAPALALDS